MRLIILLKGIPFDVDDEILSPSTPRATSVELEDSENEDLFYHPPTPTMERQRSVHVCNYPHNLFKIR
jgi:hypothetical protein